MKIRDVTPSSFTCDGGSCPIVYETDKGTYLIIGNKVDSPEKLLLGKIGLDETIIEVPAGLIRGVAIRKQE